MTARPLVRVPPEWLKFVAAWGLGLAELSQATPTAPSPLQPAPAPRIRSQPVRGRG